MKIAINILAFILITQVNAEYLINRQSNTGLALLSLLIEVAVFYYILYRPLKTIYKKL